MKYKQNYIKESNMYEEIIEALITLKDQLKADGYKWQDYECINKACNILEKLQKQ